MQVTGYKFQVACNAERLNGPVTCNPKPATPGFQKEE
jgi:hypothetical protein